MTARRARHADGFTLIEMLAAIGVISLVMSLSTMAFAQVIRLRGAQDRYNQRLAAADFLLRRVARDVRSGRAFAGKAEAYNSGADTMIVSTASAVVIYRSFGGKVERIEIVKGRTTRQLLINSPGMNVSFDFEDAPPDSARSVVTTVEWTEPPTIGVSRPTLSLRAALRSR